ncbi:nitrate ABC transporter substrate-binding protein [Janibacter sp. Soil728]|uniref:ABC transporter substrate-binding protein n=1 Tax=Janibacter sp. Soil728 TaxID=1736393 RepID=UPI0006F50299|nr:ABC transporter substrate-binding protein [Janibacter sp. Soil728]KRE38805.1 nitrate ABC transporter substrate-binding protein [Janibacter sp. Soil728]
MKATRMLAMAGAASIALALAGCGGDSDGSAAATDGTLEKTELKVGSLPLTDYAALYWANEKGFFEKEGLKVTIEPVQGGPAGVQKVVSGELDLTNSTPFGTAMAVDSGLPIRSVVLTSALADNGIGIFVPEASSIKGIKDLDGKTIGINTTKNMGDITFNNLAKSEGVDVTPKWVEVPFPEMISGVKAKSIDAGYMPEPFMSGARSAGLREVVDNTAGPNKGLAGSTYVASQKFLDANPDTAAAFARAMYKAGGDLNKNEDEARSWLPTIAKLPKSVAKDMPLPTYYDEMNTESYTKAVDILKEQKLVKADLDVNKTLWAPKK